MAHADLYDESNGDQNRIDRDRDVIGESVKWYGILLAAVLGIIVGSVIGYLLAPGAVP